MRVRDAVRNEGSGPLDEAGFGEDRGERHQPAHPEHRVPGALFGEDVLPGEDAGDEHDGDREHCDRRGTQTREAARGPEHEAHQEDEGEHEFVAGHRPHLLEFVTRDLTCIRNLPDFGRRNPEEDERHEEQADEARYDGGDRPLHSGELDSDGRPTQSGLPAIEVRDIMQVTASAWKPTCIRYLPMRPAVGSGSESKALESDWTIG